MIVRLTDLEATLEDRGIAHISIVVCHGGWRVVVPGKPPAFGTSITAAINAALKVKK